MDHSTGKVMMPRSFNMYIPFLFPLLILGYISVGSNVDDNGMSKSVSCMLQRSINPLEIDFLSKMLYALK